MRGCTDSSYFAAMLRILLFPLFPFRPHRACGDAPTAPVSKKGVGMHRILLFPLFPLLVLTSSLLLMIPSRMFMASLLLRRQQPRLTHPTPHVPNTSRPQYLTSPIPHVPSRPQILTSPYLTSLYDRARARASSVPAVPLFPSRPPHLTSPNSSPRVPQFLTSRPPIPHLTSPDSSPHVPNSSPHVP